MSQNSNLHCYCSNLKAFINPSNIYLIIILHFVCYSYAMGSENKDIDTIEGYIRTVGNQELKAVLLKLKNEIRKSGLLWEDLRPVLRTLLAKDKDSFMDVLVLLLNENK